LKEYDLDLTKLIHRVDIMEQKQKMPIFKKKKDDLEESITERVISPDGLDELRTIQHG
jgi:hypothetical protein